MEEKNLFSDQITCKQMDKDGTPGLSIAELYNYLQPEVGKLVKTKYPKTQTPFVLKAALEDKTVIWGY